MISVDLKYVNGLRNFILLVVLEVMCPYDLLLVSRGIAFSCPLILTQQDNLIHADVTTNLFVTLSNDNYITNV